MMAKASFALLQAPITTKNDGFSDVFVPHFLASNRPLPTQTVLFSLPWEFMWRVG